MSPRHTFSGTVCRTTMVLSNFPFRQPLFKPDLSCRRNSHSIEEIVSHRICRIPCSGGPETRHLLRKAGRGAVESYRTSVGGYCRRSRRQLWSRPDIDCEGGSTDKRRSCCIIKTKEGCARAITKDIHIRRLEPHEIDKDVLYSLE